MLIRSSRIAVTLGFVLCPMTVLGATTDEIFDDLAKHKEDIASYLSEESRQEMSGEELIRSYLNDTLAECVENSYIGFTFNPKDGLVAWQWSGLKLPGWNSQIEMPIKWHQGVYEISGESLGYQAASNSIDAVAGFSITAGTYLQYRYLKISEGDMQWSPWYRSGQRSELEYPPRFNMQFVRHEGTWRVDPPAPFNVDSFIIDGNDYSELRFREAILSVAPEAEVVLRSSQCTTETVSAPAPERAVDAETWKKFCAENINLLFPEFERIKSVDKPAGNPHDFRNTAQCRTDVQEGWNNRCEDLFYINRGSFNSELQELVRKSWKQEVSRADLSAFAVGQIDEWRKLYITESYQLLWQDCAVDGRSPF